jgi:predicted nucleotidyltransferase
MTIVDILRDNLREFGVTAAIVFGSFIEQKEYRDIDVLIVLEESGDTGVVRDALCEIDANIDPTFVTTATFEENLLIGNPFYLNVLKGEPVIGMSLAAGMLSDARSWQARRPARSPGVTSILHYMHTEEQNGQMNILTAMLPVNS